MKESYHHGNLHETLVAASLELVREGGVAALSLRQAARRANVSPGAPYHHFKSRVHLMEEIAIHGFERLRRVLHEASRDPAVGVLDRLEAASLAYLDFARQSPEYFQVMFHPELADRSQFPRVAAASTAVISLLVTLVGEAQSARLAPPGNVMLLGITIWSAVHGIASLVRDGPLCAEWDALEAPISDVGPAVVATVRKLLQAAAPSAG